MKTSAVVALVAIASACGPAASRTAPRPVIAAPAFAVVPRPVVVDMRGGAPFVLTDSSTIVVNASDAAVSRIANDFARRLRVPTGFGVLVGDGSSAVRRGVIRLRLDESRTDLGDEGYTLLVTGDSVALTARRAAGLFHGVQTVRQLLPVTLESDIGERPSGGWAIPALAITDYPRFAWRGAMLDVARHFFTVDEVKQYIDLLALYKINVLHLHLSDDQGWRMEIASRPLLTARSSTGEMGTGEGGFYTKADYAEIIRYAADRFILIVPEIEMPAHAYAMTSAYPQAGCQAVCPDSAEAYRLIDDIVREVADETPGPYFHIGGDEVATLSKEQYVRFIERAQQIVTAHGKRMIGWEEIVQARLQPTTIAQQWRTDSVKSALAYGTKLILSPATRIYLDMKYNSATELGLDWAALVGVRTSYDWNPGTFITGVSETDILGVEAPLWSETVRNLGAAFFLTVPRLPAVAEVGWTPQQARQWEDFRERIAAHAPRWRLLGVNYYPSDEIDWR